MVHAAMARSNYSSVAASDPLEELRNPPLRMGLDLNSLRNFRAAFARFGWPHVGELAVIHLQDAVGDVEVAVVV